MVTLAALGWTVVDAQQNGRPSWPSAPWERGGVAEGLPVSPFFEGWYENPDGTYTLSFGYFNRNREEAIRLPLGPGNFITPDEYDGHQPTLFAPGRATGVFTVTVPREFGRERGRVEWTLQSHGPSPHSVPGKVGVEAYRLHHAPMAMGSLPPMLKLQEEGPVLRGAMTLRRRHPGGLYLAGSRAPRRQPAESLSDDGVRWRTADADGLGGGPPRPGRGTRAGRGGRNLGHSSRPSAGGVQ